MYSNNIISVIVTSVNTNFNKMARQLDSCIKNVAVSDTVEVFATLRKLENQADPC